MEHLKSEEWYLWRRHSNKKYPWERYLNTDFLKSERKRINDVNGWMKNFQRVPYRASLEEVCYYVVPIKIKPSWLTYLGAGNYLCKGLSALRNCPIYPLIAFFPSGKIPTDYSLIRINSSKKIALLDSYTKSTIGEYAIIVEDWEKRESDYIYPDVPVESGIIRKIIEENINAEKPMAESLQSPLISSPFVLGDVGGISLASILDGSDFAHELCKTMELMLPPEYRSFSPPKSGVRGRNMDIRNGIEIHVAERIVTGRNYLSSVEGSTFKLMDVESKRRFSFQGEYSILGAMIKSHSTGIQLYKDMLHKFFEFEVSIPDLSKLIEYDAYIPDLTKAIDEDIWLQVVSMRRKTPPISISPQEEKRLREGIKEDIETVLCERTPEQYRGVLSEMKAEKCIENLKREAKSLARAEGRKTVDFSLLKHARNNFLDRFWDLENDVTFRNIKYNAKIEWNNIRSFIVENILRELGRATAEEIYQRVSLNGNFRTFFNDIEDLKSLLRSLQRKDWVIKDPQNRYIWV